MTVQEAIRILEQSCPKRPQKLWSVKRKEAVKMAIEALTENDNLKRKIEILEHDIKAQTGGMYIDLTKVNATA